jgi:hypothetical protein
MTVTIAGHVCVLADRVKETTQTTGTGSYELDGAGTGLVSFVNGVGNGNKCPYAAVLGSSWEIGIGTVASGAPPTIARTDVLKSSNSDAAVNWTAGVKDIWLSAPADFLGQLTAKYPGDARALISGTSDEVTTIPEGVRRVTVLIDRVSLDSTNELQIQVGPSGGVLTSGYLGSCVKLEDAAAVSVENNSTAVQMTTVSVAAAIYSGKLTLTALDETSNTWLYEGSLTSQATTVQFRTMGRIDLSAALARVKLLSVANFDGSTGQWNVTWEF